MRDGKKEPEISPRSLCNRPLKNCVESINELHTVAFLLYVVKYTLIECKFAILYAIFQTPMRAPNTLKAAIGAACAVLVAFHPHHHISGVESRKKGSRKVPLN